MGELIIPVIMMLVGGIFYVDAGRLPVYEENLPMSSASYPEIIALLLMACSAYLIIRFFIKRRQFIAAERKMLFDPRVLLVFGLFVLFYFALPYFGYIPSAFFFLLLLSLFFQRGKPQLKDTVLLPAGLAVGLYFAFGFMSIYLPTGSLFQGLF